MSAAGAATDAAGAGDEAAGAEGEEGEESDGVAAPILVEAPITLSYVSRNLGSKLASVLGSIIFFLI